MSEATKRRRRRAAKAASDDASPTPEVESAGAGAAAREAAAAPPAPARNALVPILVGVAVVALATYLFWPRGTGPEAARDATGQSIQLVSEKKDLAVGTTVRVYWRAVPVDARMFAKEPYASSFELVAEASPFGGGGIRGRVIREELAKAKLPGRMIQTWFAEKKPNVAFDDWTGSGAQSFGDDEIRSQHLIDAEGRAVIFVDVETWAPGQAQPDCAGSPGCSLSGKCTAREGDCVVATDADCARSMSCKNNGECVARAGDCKVGSDAACRKREACADAGRCTEKNGDCVAADQADCDASVRCKDLLADEACFVQDGSCSRTSKPDWKPATAADCKGSTGCKQQGRCDLGADKCVAGSDEGCAASEGCRQSGACARIGDRCVPKTAAHCETSEGCRVRGNCGLIEDECLAKKDEHCLSSENCKKLGWCARDSMRCKAP